MNNRSEEQTETLLDKCGDLLISQSQQLQQMLQQQRQSSEAASSAAGLSRKLCSALLILELHSNYSGRLFDLLKSELLTALNLELNTLRNIDVSSLDYREATRLLKDLCLRSKAMSHDVIKGSRDLLKAFKTVQRSDKRPRSSSALSRVRDLAMAPSKCRSNSQSGRQTATASRRDATGTSKADRPMAQKPMMVKSFALFGLKKSLTDRPPKQLPPLPPATASTPVPAASSLPAARKPKASKSVTLLNLARSHSYLSPKSSKPSLPPPVADASESKGPVPPRRSSSLNSMPPDLQLILQRHRQLHQPQFQSSQRRLAEPRIGRETACFPCLKIATTMEQQRTVGPTILQQQQSEAHKPGSLKASVSTEGTTQLLPSETSGSPNSVGDSKRIPDKVETISDTATKVSELDGAWNGFYSSTSANLSELDCTESAAVRNQIAPRSSPQQDATIVDSTAVPAESKACIQKLHQLQRLPADDEAAQSQPVPVLVRRQRRRRPRRTHPSLISGGTSGKPAATTAVASRPRKFSEAPPTTRRSGIGSGFSGDDESSRTQSASQKRRPCSGNVRYLASGVFETDV